MGTRPRGSRSPRATPAGRSTSPPHAATAGGPARAPGTSRGAPGGPRGRATAEGRAGGGEQRPPLSPRSRGACSRAVGRACCCGCDAGRPRLTLLLTHARPRLTFSHTRSRTLRLPSAPTDQRHHTTAKKPNEQKQYRQVHLQLCRSSDTFASSSVCSITSKYLLRSSL